jgi:hypothetical protein
MGETQTLFTKSNTISISYSNYKHWFLNNNNNNLDGIGLMLQAT